MHWSQVKEIKKKYRGFYLILTLDVTQGEDRSRIRTTPLPQIMAIARNLAINLDRDAGFSNMAQAQRKCGFGLKQILTLFRMK
jgi:hypothetical protein